METENEIRHVKPIAPVVNCNSTTTRMLVWRRFMKGNTDLEFVRKGEIQEANDDYREIDIQIPCAL